MERSPFITLKGVCQLIGLPFNLLITLVRYFTIGVRCRKYQNDLWKALKHTVYRTAVSLRATDTKIIAMDTNEYIIKKIIGRRFPDIVRNFPGYGTPYDKLSYWLVKQPGRHQDDPIIIYLHGGGYFLQTAPEQLESMLAAYKLLDPQVKSKTSVLLLDYSLVSWGYPLPTQLNELTMVYRNLTLRDKNTNITFIGDSAGGNLAIAFTQHLKQQQAENTVVDPIYPKNLVLVSPWSKLVPEPNQYVPGKSYYDNDNYDYIRFQYFKDHNMLKDLIGKSDLHSLTISPNSKKPQTNSDWNDIPTYASEESNVFVVCGEDETFRDDVLEFANYALDCKLNETTVYGRSKNHFNEKIHKYVRKPSPGKAGLELYVEPWGVHDSFFFFENHLLRKIQAAEKKGKVLTVDDLDETEFFSSVKIVRFLNRVLK